MADLPTILDQAFVTIPVVRSFNMQDVIGYMTIRKDASPSSPDFVFSLGYRCHSDGSPSEVLVVSLMHDAEYFDFLKFRGKDQTRTTTGETDG